MKQRGQRGLGFLLTLALLLGLTARASAAVNNRALEAAVQDTAAYLVQTVSRPQVGPIGGEWAIIGLARSGYAVPQSYWDDYYRTVEEYVKACGGVLHEKKYTEYSRVIVALTAIGADPTDVAGYDLTKPLGDYDKTIWQGINGPTWALIALDCGNYDVPLDPEAGTQATRQLYIDRILDCQLPDGGWSLLGGATEENKGGRSDPDITGMALQALAKYQDQPAVAEATKEALACLSGMQDADGGYASWGSTNSESVVQVIVALCELGIDLDDPRFVKNGKTLLDSLMGFRQSGGGFQHTTSGAGSNQMAAEQGLYGLVAALRAQKNQSSLYRMDDVVIHAGPGAGPVQPGLPGKDPAVKKPAVTSPGKTFPDVSGENAHPNQTAIEALAARGILKGSDGLFNPEDTMTRAEFAAMVVRTLGLTPQITDKFSDVPASAWYAGEVGAASASGIINGVGGGKFDPLGTVTREEGAAMVSRAAKLCGVDTDLDDGAVRNVLAQFSDYITASTWARGGLAVCYREGILDDPALTIRPKAAVKRCEMAQMLFNLLGTARLL